MTPVIADDIQVDQPIVGLELDPVLRYPVDVAPMLK
jgi:hypothetical protein